LHLVLEANLFALSAILADDHPETRRRERREQSERDEQPRRQPHLRSPRVTLPRSQPNPADEEGMVVSARRPPCTRISPMTPMRIVRVIWRAGTSACLGGCLTRSAAVA